MLRTLRLVGVALAGVALAATAAVVVPDAATSAPLVDRKGLSEQVAATVSSTYPDLPVTKVTCPRLARKAGASVACDVDAGGLSLVIRVTATDRTGSVSIESTQAIIPKTAAEDFVRANSTVAPQVDCGTDARIVRPPGMPFQCRASFGDGTVQHVIVSPTDVTGAVAITLVR